MMNPLENRSGRVVLFAWLYASEGGPIGFIWWALPTLLRSENVPVEKITGLVAVLVLPWTFKFLWSPLVDALRTPRWGFRAWIISAQLVMGLALLPLVWLDPVENFTAWAALLAVHAFAAATQDVSVDAMAIRYVPASERGTINGCMQMGMLLGRSLFGGGAILAASRLGWNWTMLALIGCVWSSLVLVLFVRESHEVERASLRERFGEFGVSLRRAFSRRVTWLGLAFALTAAAAFEATGALAGPFMIDRGVAKGTVGVFFGLPVIAAMMVGAVFGGRLSDRWGRTRMVGVFLAGSVAMVLALGVVDRSFAGAAPVTALLGILTGMYLFIGLFTAASYAMFMDLTDPKLGATQFSTFMAATNGCESWATWAGGRIVAFTGYPAGFFAMSAVSLLSLPLLGLISRDAKSAGRE